MDKIQQIKQEIENYKLQADRAEREGDYATVAELRYGKIKASQQTLDQLHLKLLEYQEKDSLIKEEVNYDDIADVVAKWTGIPTSKMLQSDKERFLNLEKEIHKRMVGQETAVQAVSDVPSDVVGQEYKTKTAPLEVFYSWEPQEWKKPNWPKHWPKCFLMTKTTSPAST